ncbi:hypothetical protein TNCV_803451 [Trichonephila clavipes]|nr:hypothetical protein TNCV_803451 [Trichonephila clavipes]
MKKKSSNIITETDVINDAELPKNPAIEERNEKECSAISSNDEHLAISQCIDLEKKTIDEEKSSNIIIETDVINDAELPKNPAIEERNEKECSAISSNDEHLAISQCIDLEKKTIDDEKSSNIIIETDVINDAELPKNPVIEERNEKECSAISSNDEHLAISQCIDLEKKTIDDEKSSNIIIETDVINDAELPTNPVIEERNEKECSAISSNDENLVISQCIDLEKKTIDEEKSSNIIFETDVINDAELPKNPVIEERNEKECSAISSNDENLEISQCIDPEKKSYAGINEDKSSNIIFETDVINDAELPKNPVIEERTAISSNDENLEISQCIYPEKKSYAGINEEKSTEITTVTDVKNDTELLKKLINEGRNGKECLPTSVKNSHVQCLANSHLFLNVALFIVSSISKQEFSCAYSSESACIKKKSELLKNTKKVESFDELNANIDKIASSETEELHSSGSFEIIENGEIANMVLKIDEKENNDEKQIVECANCIQSVDLSKRNDNVDGIPCTEINMEINNFDKILTDSSTTTSETDVVKKGNKKEIPNESNMECDKNISNSEIVGCDLVVVDSHYNSDSSEMGLSSLSESCANSFQIISPFGEDILKELKTIEGKIHVLIKESYPSLLSYPDPFETLQNVFQVLYSMWQKSECSVAREELHKYMDQIIQYSHSFFDGKMELRCEICFSK